MMFNVTFNNISVILWHSVLLVEETGGPGENHRPVASHWQTLSHNVIHLPDGVGEGKEVFHELLKSFTGEKIFCAGIIWLFAVIKWGPSWSWSYGSWIYNYLCNQCLSPLKLWVRPVRVEVYSIQHFVIKFVSNLWQVWMLHLNNKSIHNKRKSVEG
jgi:hypothetical protein